MKSKLTGCLFDLCSAYDDAERAFSSQGTREASAALDTARLALTSTVRSAMEAVRVTGGVHLGAVGNLTYFSAWLALRGGWKY